MFISILAFITAFFIALAITPVVKHICCRTGRLSYPKDDRWHKRPTALFGGIGMYLAFVVPLLIFYPHTRVFWGLLFGSTAIFALGLTDDLLHFRPHTKLIVQIIVACLMIPFGIGIDFLRYPMIAVPATIFFLVAIINAFNLLDNMDGLAAGVACISAMIMAVYSAMEGRFETALLALFIAGATAGFLKYNFYPAKIFMGDCGSLFLGFVLGATALIDASRHTSNLLVTLAFPVFILSVPIFDTAFVAIMRLFNKRPVSKGGRDHTSHRLVALGISEKKAVRILYLISFLFGMLALLQRGVGEMTLIILAGVLAIILFFFGLFLGEVKLYSKEEISKKRRPEGTFILRDFLQYKRKIAEVIIDLILICIAYYSAFLLRFEGVISPLNNALIRQSFPVVIAAQFSSFVYFGLYRGVWKYVSLSDLMSVFKAVSTGTIAAIIILVFTGIFAGLSRAVFIIDWLILLVAVAGVRVLLRLFREFFLSLAGSGRPTLIVGAGDGGELALREIRQNRELGLNVAGFIDDNRLKKGKRIHGIAVLGAVKNISAIIRSYKIEEIIVAIPSLKGKERIKEIFEECRKSGLSPKLMSTVIS